MAKVFVTEFPGSIDGVVNASAPINQTPVAIGGSSAQSAAFNRKTKIVRIHTDAICSIEFGANPTATANSYRMSANQTEFFAVAAGQKIAVITNT